MTIVGVAVVVAAAAETVMESVSVSGRRAWKSDVGWRRLRGFENNNNNLDDDVTTGDKTPWKMRNGD